MIYMKKVIFCALLFLLLVPTACLAAPHDASVYVLIVDKLTIQDIQPNTTPNLYRAAASGSVGLSSNRTLGSGTTEDACLTIGAGNLARAYVRTLQAYNRNEPVNIYGKQAESLFPLLCGASAENSQVLLMNLPEIQAGMLEESVDSRLGILGDLLKRQGYSVAVYGNADVPDQVSRPAVGIAMDVYGRVQAGDVGVNTLRPSSGVLDLETNYDAILAEINRSYGPNQVVFADLSDLARLEESTIPSPEGLTLERTRILMNIDRFAGGLLKHVDRNKDLFMVIAPSPSAVEIENKNTFTPVILLGPGYKQGILTSPATRRPYVMASTDIAPTILSFLGIPKDTATMIGQPAYMVPAAGDQALTETAAFNSQSATTNRLRTPLVKGYVVLLIIAILLALIAILWFPQLNRFALPLILSTETIPLVFLPLGMLRLPADWQYIAAAAAASVIVTWACIALTRRDYYKAFIMVAGVTLLALNIDLLTGAAMIKSSVLGYDPMVGARYYGVGNEYMGIMIGSALVIGSILFKRFQQRWILLPVGLFFLIEAFFIAAPWLGANSDGVITAPIAFLVTFALLAGIRMRPRTLLAILAATALCVLSLVAFDISRPPELQSHIGRAASQIVTGGWQEAFTIIARKLGMNIKLIRYTIWSRVFLVMLGALMLLIFRPVGATAILRDKNPALFKGFAGIITGAFIGLIINDSGIVAAATTSIYIAVPVLLLLINDVMPEYRTQLLKPRQKPD